MNSTKLYFLLSFKKQEYNQLKIEINLIKEQKYENDKITNIIEINNINNYLIKIGIYDFKKKKSEKYRGFHIIIKYKNAEYWTDQKQFISHSNNFIFDNIFNKSNNRKFLNPPESYNLEINNQYYYFCKYIETLDNIEIFSDLNRDIMNYLPYINENTNIGIVFFSVLRRLFMYDDKQSIKNLFICEIQFDFIKKIKYSELNNYKNVIRNLEELNFDKLNYDDEYEKMRGYNNYFQVLINFYVLTGSANKVIELIQNNPDTYQYIPNYYAFNQNDPMKFMDKNIFYNALNYIDKNKPIPKELFILFLSSLNNKYIQYEIIFQENPKLLQYLPSDIQNLILNKQENDYIMDIGFILELTNFEKEKPNCQELIKYVHENLQKYYFVECEGNYFKELFTFDLNATYSNLIKERIMDFKKMEMFQEKNY